MQTIDRRQLVHGAAYLAAVLLDGPKLEQPRAANDAPHFVASDDGTKLFVQDWGRGRPVVFLSAWTFHSNVWGATSPRLPRLDYAALHPTTVATFGRSQPRVRSEYVGR